MDLNPEVFFDTEGMFVFERRPLSKAQSALLNEFRACARELVAFVNADQIKLTQSHLIMGTLFLADNTGHYLVVTQANKVGFCRDLNLDNLEMMVRQESLEVAIKAMRSLIVRARDI